mgnify:CR=1 FL=1|jgi:hypothetical protein
MNTKTLKGITAAVTLLVGIGAAPSVLALSTGPQTLGSAANSVDVWTLECALANAKAVVSDGPNINGPAKLQVVLSFDGNPTVQRTDNAPVGQNGEGGGSSGVASVSDGAGQYVMTVKKTAGGQDDYEANVVCFDGGITVDPVGLQRRINQ